MNGKLSKNEAVLTMCVIVNLYRFPEDETATEIARRLHTGRARIVRILWGLRLMGLIGHYVKGSNGRRKHYFIHEEGRNLYAALPEMAVWTYLDVEAER